MDLFSECELQQYKPHLLLDSVGIEGQRKLKEAKVLCIGAGGLGSPLLLYLTGAGIGTIGIVDNDTVEVSNLQRQILFTQTDLGKKKAIVAKERLLRLNPHLHINAYAVRLTTENAKSLFSEYDLVVDGSDNFETRYLVNHTCLVLKKVNVSASVSDFKGQCSVFVPYEGPCYHCLFPANQGEELLSNCRERGILGVLPGILGTLQATEVIKWILQIGTPLVGKLLQIDVLSLEYKIFTVEQNPDCTMCGVEMLPPFSYRKPFCQTEDSVTIEAFKQDLKSLFLLDVREPIEHVTYHLGGINIPLPELPQRFHELPKDQLIVAYCQSGRRSFEATQFLKGSGFQVKNLTGGVEAWLQKERVG